MHYSHVGVLVLLVHVGAILLTGCLRPTRLHGALAATPRGWRAVLGAAPASGSLLSKVKKMNPKSGFQV